VTSKHICWNVRALYYVDYRESGIFVHCIMLTIVNLACSCILLCRLSWFWNLRALYYVDYRESGIFMHIIMLTIVNLACSCTLLCPLSWVWNLRAPYCVHYCEFGMLFIHFIIQQLHLASRWGYVTNAYNTVVDKTKVVWDSEVRENAAAVNAYPDVTKLPAPSLHTWGNVLVRSLPFV